MRLPVLFALVALGFLAALPAQAGEDPLAEAKSLVEQGTRAVEIGTEKSDAARIRTGLEHFREAAGLFRQALGAPGLDTAAQNRIRAQLADVESRIQWYEDVLDPDDEEPATIEVPERKRRESAAAWARRIRALYDETEGAADRAVLAGALAESGGLPAVRILFELFESETDRRGRKGIHAALARVGTRTVAKKMGSYARREEQARWDAALDVIYRCLAKPEEDEPEAPFLRAVRRFHALRDRALTLRILSRLDALGAAGTAALGEVLYVPDFGGHAVAVARLGARQDRRAAPPLIHVLTDTPFDDDTPTPAHEALLALEWHAVPSLVDRVGEKGTEPWLSWTLHRITGQSFGSKKRAWRTWWAKAKADHPDVLADPERPASAARKRPERGGVGK